MLILSVMISIPFFDVDTYIQHYVSYESGLNTLYRIKKSNFNNTISPELYNFSKEVFINESNHGKRTPIIAMWIMNDTLVKEDGEEFS